MLVQMGIIVAPQEDKHFTLIKSTTSQNNFTILFTLITQLLISQEVRTVYSPGLGHVTNLVTAVFSLVSAFPHFILLLLLLLLYYYYVFLSFLPSTLYLL